MTIEIKNYVTGDVIKTIKAATLRDANLRDADLRYANLRDADLRGADLIRADLRDATLSYANLRYANLRYANLSYANLRDADLRGADLRDANLRGANLSYADLSYANLRDADLSYANLRYAKNLAPLAAARLSVVPETGGYVGWKKCLGGVIVRLWIEGGARRSNATGRKCRAEWATVLEVIGAPLGVSQYDSRIVYEAGKLVRCDAWNEDRWMECGGGIHHYITRAEAEDHI